MNWAASEQSRIDAYKLTCTTTSPYTNRSSHYANQGLPAVSIEPRTIKFYSMLGAPPSPNRGKHNINSSAFELRNNMPSAAMQFSVVSSSVPSWLALSSLSGEIGALETVTLKLSANQVAVDAW